MNYSPRVFFHSRNDAKYRATFKKNIISVLCAAFTFFLFTLHVQTRGMDSRWTEERNKKGDRMDRVCFHRDKREHCGDYRLPWLTMFFISHGSRCYRRFFIRDRKYTSCHVKNQMWRAVYRPQPHHTYCSPAGVPIISPALIPSAVSIVERVSK